MIKEILQKQKVSVTEFAAIMNLSRNRLYQCFKAYEEDKSSIKNRKISWAFDTLFSEELTYDEFYTRLMDVKVKLSDKDSKYIEKDYSPYCEAFEISKGTYITKNYIRKFEYRQLDKLNYELIINDNERYCIRLNKMINFLRMYNIEL